MSKAEQNLKLLIAHTFSKQKPAKAIVKLGYACLVLTLIFLLLIPVIYMLGSKRIHRHNMNMLYDIFQQSPKHLQLYQQLAKTKYALIYGSQQAGLFNFIDHFANKQSLKQRDVMVQDFHTTGSMLTEWIQELKFLLEQFLDLEDKFKKIWILTSKTGENIPKTAILKIIHRHPKDKILIVITRKQKVPSFEVFEYPEITGHDIKESIERNFEMDENTADILYDFFGTPQTVLDALDIGHYTQQQLLGAYYRDLIDFSQEDVRILRDLCKKGQASAEGISEQLVQFGLLNHQGQTLWSNRYFMLNYELHKKIRCEDKGVVTDQTLFQIEQDLDSFEIEKTEEELLEEQVWNEDEIFSLQSAPKNKKSQSKSKPQSKSQSQSKSRFKSSSKSKN